MKLGIFTKTFQRSSLEAKLDAVTAYGMTEVQFNLSCAGLPSLPDDPEELDAATCAADPRHVRAPRRHDVGDFGHV